MRVLWKLKKDFNPFTTIIHWKKSLHKITEEIILKGNTEAVVR